MNMNSRRLQRSVAVLVTFGALTACATQKDDEKQAEPSASASPTPTTTPTTTPDQVQAFCNALVALDTAKISLGPPDEPEEPAASPSGTPSADSMDHGSMDHGSMASAAPSATPTATGAPEGDEAGGPPSFPDVATAMAPAADQLDATKTREIAGAADVMVGILRQAVSTNNRELLENEAFGAADAPLDSYGLQNCGYKPISVSAVDYEFDGVPATATVGKTTITLKNEGEEFHEIVLLRINDGVTDSVDDILALPQEQIFSKISLAFVTVVPPGMSGTGFTDLRAGKYIVLCFIPKGAKPGAEPPADAPPHFIEGMLEELVVS